MYFGSPAMVESSSAKRLDISGPPLDPHDTITSGAEKRVAQHGKRCRG